jgi:membrane protease YdiL (CAAX protease family)
VTPELPPPPPARPDTSAAGPRGLPAVAWDWWQAAAVFLFGNVLIGQVLVGTIVLMAMGVAAGEPIEGLPQIAASIGADAAFLAVMLGWLTWRVPDWRRRIGVVLGRTGLRDALVGFGAGLILYGVVAFAIGGPLLALFRLVFGDQVNSPEQIPQHLSANAKALTVFLALVLAPVTEELFYRGILYRGVRDHHGVALGVLVSSLLFGASHLVAAPWRDALFLQTIMVFTGAGLALIYERRANLVADIAAHLAFNVVGILLIFSGR